MKLFIGADHAGFELKQKIKDFLAKSSVGKNWQLIDVGAKNLKQEDDYPDFVIKVGRGVKRSSKNLGILICRSGIGMSIAANKIHGIRAGLCTGAGQAVTSRAHNDCNVLVLSANLDLEQNLSIVETFLQGRFSQEEKHKRRIEKIKEIENRQI